MAVGDITTDTFIQLSEKDASVVCDISGKPCQLMMNFGDKLPYESVKDVHAVGNASNAAVAAKRLGLKSALVANLGHDRNGADCLASLRRDGVHTEYVKVHEHKISNHHYVLRYGAERTILIKHETYPYLLPDFADAPRYIYFSSIGENGLEFHHDIARYVAAHPEAKLVFQPGTFQIRLGKDELKDLYAVTDIFFCNKEEAKSILGSKDDDPAALLRQLSALGPNTPVITDGPNGAYALEGDGVWFMPMYPDPAPPKDRTGAGDSFASTFTAARALGLDVQTALSWAPINSMSVVQYIGAQEGLLTREKLEAFLADAPAEFKAKKLA
jgi:ribokinase